MKSLVNSVSEGKLDLCVVELQSVSPSALGGSNFLNLDNLDGMGTSSVASSHITITSCYSLAGSKISVFPVHVVSTTTRIVSQPDAKVLDL